MTQHRWESWSTKQFYARMLPLNGLTTAVFVLGVSPAPAVVRLMAILLVFPLVAYGGYLTVKWSQAHPPSRRR